MASEAARLVDELTTLLYGVVKRWQLQNGRVCEIVQCGACRKKADKPESVVHESDCPVYRLIRAEEADTAVIRANADEIADLEDKRAAFEAQVNALTAQMECRNELTARIRALEIENRALRRQVRATYGIIHEGLHGGSPTDPEHQELCERPACRNARAALAGGREQATTTEGEYMTRRISVPAFVFDGPHDGCSYYLLSIDGEVADADGCHGSPQGVAKAKRLIESINAIRKPAGRRYAMIRVSDVPDHMGRINQDAIDTLNAAQRRTGGQDRGDGAN